GVFVFPSVHYILFSIRSGRKLLNSWPEYPSLRWARQPDYREKSDFGAYGPGPIAPQPNNNLPNDSMVDFTSPLATWNWPTPWCFELVGGGVPLRKCTVIIGRRGARKSYFAYQFLLDGISNGERTLVLSFRDNPAAVLETMNQIRRGT